MNITDPIPKQTIDKRPGDLTSLDFESGEALARAWYAYIQKLKATLDVSHDPHDLTEYLNQKLAYDAMRIELGLLFPDTALAAASRQPQPEYAKTAASSLKDYGVGIGKEVPAAVIHAAFQTEPKNQGLHRMIVLGMEQGEYLLNIAGKHMQVVLDAYGVENYADLLGKLDQDDEFDKLLSDALLEPRIIESVSHRTQDLPVGASSEMRQQANRESYRSYASALMPDAPDEFNDSIAFGMTRGGKAHDVFATAFVNIEYLGQEKAIALFEKIGTTLFGYYTPEQLALMESVFIDNDPAEIERLQQTDSRIVFINSGGDHNGGLREVPDLYADEENATLFIEVGSFRDIYKGFIELRKKGIKPSSVVFAQHAFAGQMNLEQRSSPNGERTSIEGIHSSTPGWIKDNEEQLKNEDHATVFSIAHDGAGFSRLIHEYLQSNSITNEKQVIFHGCLLAKDVDRRVSDMETSDVTSFIRDFAKVLDGEEDYIRMFAFSESMNLRKTDDNTGLTALMRVSETADTDAYRTHLDATCIEITDGQQKEYTVPAVPLSK